MIRIANGQGFWGDWLEAPVRLIDPLDTRAILTQALEACSGCSGVGLRPAQPNFGSPS